MIGCPLRIACMRGRLKIIYQLNHCAYRPPPQVYCSKLFVSIPYIISITINIYEIISDMILLLFLYSAVYFGIIYDSSTQYSRLSAFSREWRMKG